MQTRNLTLATATAVPAILCVLAACGGGGGGSLTAQVPDDPGTGQPPMVTEPMPPAMPTVNDGVTVANDAAIDPTLAFRAVRVPTAEGFDVTVTAPQNPVTVFTRHDRPGSPTPPTDLDAMAARAALLWTRRLTDNGPQPFDPRPNRDTHPVTLQVGATCLSGIACATIPSGNRPGPSGIKLTNQFLTERTAPNNKLSITHFKTLVHEVGHTLRYRDPITGGGHADCSSTQIMCGHAGFHRVVSPTAADFAGLYTWTVGPDLGDHQSFGLWAVAPTSSALDGFGVTVTRALSVAANARTAPLTTPAEDYITDTIRIEADVRGTPTSGPATGMGTATWSGVFLGADAGRFEPVTGDATLTADLEDLTTISLSLSDLLRIDGGGATHPLAAIDYELERHGNAWIDAHGRADARFYTAGADPAGAAAGLVSDDTRELIGAWGATR